MVTTLVLTSEVIGFISFGITLITLLGVYRDAISSIRHAPTEIPIRLGNLRQEILSEKAFLRFRLRENDTFRVFPSSLAAPATRRRRRESKGAYLARERTKQRWAFTRLMDATMKELWNEFRNVERPFLIRGAFRAEEVRKGDYWSDSDIDEKRDTDFGRDGYPRGETGRRRTTVDDTEAGQEAGTSQYGKDYYRTDFTHRFIWWRSAGRVASLEEQVQRIQIRRIERDVFETDELVKRLLARNGGSGRASGRKGSGSGSGSSSGSYVSRRRSNVSRAQSVVRSRAGSIATRSRAGSVTAPAPGRRSSVSDARNFREVDEREVIRRGRAPSSPPRPTTNRPSDVEASNTGRRRERPSEPRVEYEIIRPGRIYVDMNDADDGYGRQDRGGTRR